MAESNIQVLHTFGETLTFSEEEWRGLSTWQKELYRTVMRDTAELFHSLGIMYQVKEEQELRDSWAPKIAEESLWTPESVIIEEISGENFIIQVTEMPVIQENSAVTTRNSFLSHPPQTSTNPETFLPHRDSIMTRRQLAKTANCHAAVACNSPKHSGAGLVGLDTEASTTMEGSGAGLVGLDTETFMSLGGPEDSMVSQDTDTYIIPSLGGSHVNGNADMIKTEDTSNLPSCGVASVLSHPTVVLMSGSEAQTQSSALISESDFLTIIQVEDINVGPVRELGPIQTEMWDVHTGSTNLLWNKKTEAHLKHPEAIFPVALMVSHNTRNTQNSGTADQRPLIVDPPQWCEQSGVADCQQVNDRGHWTKQGDLGAPIVEKSFQGSIFSTNYQQVMDHEMIQEQPMKQPKYETQVSTKPYLLRNHEAYPSSSHSDQSVGEPLQPSKLFSCTECGRTFSYLFQFNRHQKIHARDKLLLRPVAPPPKKVYRLPQFLPAKSREEDTKMDSTGDSCQKLHQNLQLSTVFLQNLLTSTCGFQYD